MRVTHQWGEFHYHPGSVWKECDECGFDYLTKDLLRRSDGAMVCRFCYEPKHPSLSKNEGSHKNG